MEASVYETKARAIEIAVGLIEESVDQDEGEDYIASVKRLAQESLERNGSYHDGAVAYRVFERLVNR